MTIHLEMAGPEAVALLAALHRDCFPHDPWNEAAIGNLFALPGCFARIAVRESAPIGLALALDLGGECEILALGVVPAARRGGAGRALLDGLGAVARQRGAGALLLEVAENNAPARALYEAAGFVRIGRRSGYYRHCGASVAALVLRLALVSPPST